MSISFTHRFIIDRYIVNDISLCIHSYECEVTVATRGVVFATLRPHRVVYMVRVLWNIHVRPLPSLSLLLIPSDYTLTFSIEITYIKI